MGVFKNELSSSALFSLGFGSIIGVAWIPLVGFWLKTAGSIGAIIAFTAGCLTVVFVVAAYAEIGSMYPVNGGEVSYAQVSLGSGFAFSVGWMLILLYLGFTSFEMVATGWIVCVLIPELKGPVIYSVFGNNVYSGELLIGLAACVVIHRLNVYGRGVATRFQELLSYGLVVFAVLMLAIALTFGSASNLVPLFVHPKSSSSVLGGVYSVFAMSLLFFGGFNFSTQCLGEHGPEVTPRKIANAMFLSVGAALFFYSAILLSCSYLLPRAHLLSLELPAANMFKVALNSPFLQDFVLVFGIIGLVTSWNGAVFAGARLLVMLSELRLLPKRIADMHMRHGTPVRAVRWITIFTPAIAFAGRGAIVPVAKALSFAIAFAWAVTVISAIKLRITHAHVARPFKISHAFVVLPIAGIGTLFAIYETGKDFFMPVTGVSASGFLILLWSLLGALTWILMAARRKSLSEHERTAVVLART